MARTPWDQGNVIRCSTSDGITLGFTSGGVLVDPTNVYFVCKKPDGTFIRYTYGVDAALVRDSLGLYHVDVVADVGHLTIPYQFRFYGTGTHAASATGEFYVTPDVLV